jgi:hypothetical protein
MDDSSAASMGMGGMLFMLVFFALMIASLWKVFTKAGEPGWASIIPIYNTIVMLKIAGKPWWWFILMLIPLVGLVVMIMAIVALAKNFGKGVGFAIGLIILPFIFFPILAFGDATYLGAGAA